MKENKLKISVIKGRFLQFIETQGVSAYKFSTETGISKSNFSGKSLQSELGGWQITEILNYFPNLNPDWLLLGKGAMLRSDSRNNVNMNENSNSISTINQNGNNTQHNNSTINVDLIIETIASQQKTIQTLVDLLNKNKEL